MYFATHREWELQLKIIPEILKYEAFLPDSATRLRSGIKEFAGTGFVSGIRESPPEIKAAVLSELAIALRITVGW